MRLSFYYQRESGEGPIRASVSKIDHTFTAEVLNLSRNVRIEGTQGGRTHILIHSMQPQTIRYASMRWV